MRIINYLRILTSIILILFLTNGCSDEKPVEEVITPRDYTPEPFSSLIFLGAARNAPSIYLYSPEEEHIHELWKPVKEKIIELSYSPDRSSGFFITAAKTGVKGVFPYINAIKLYVINNDTLISLAKELGNAVQIYTKWETNNAFRIITNVMNDNNPSQIIQTAQIYNTYGKLFEQEEKVYNLLQEGYPQPLKEDPEYISPHNEYEVITKSSEKDSLFFIYRSTGRKYFLLSTQSIINNIIWSPDLLNVVIELVPEEASVNGAAADILLYSIKDKKITENWKGNTPGGFFVKNNLLVFDRGRGNKASIIFYDLNTGRGIDTISMKGGCSLRTILH
jgi:hypothetical protein